MNFQENAFENVVCPMALVSQGIGVCNSVVSGIVMMT